MKIRIDATDIAAYLVIVGCIALMACRIDGEVKSILAMAAGWAFRRPIANGGSAAVEKVLRKLTAKK